MNSEEDGINEPMWVVIHICIETTQGNSLYSSLYLKLAKMSYFSHYLLFFLLQNLRTEVQNVFCLGGRRGDMGDGEVALRWGRWCK
jgi:hypothetical protein